MGIVKLTANWNTTAHRSLYHCLWKDTKELKGMHNGLTPVPRSYCVSPKVKELSKAGR